MANISALSKQPKGVNMDTLWAKMVGFLESFDPRQIRYLGEELDHIIETVAGIAMNNDQVGPIYKWRSTETDYSIALACSCPNPKRNSSSRSFRQYPDFPPSSLGKAGIGIAEP
jgi:hypothetical protein